MRRYETITILDPDLSEEGRAPVLERIEDVIVKEGGGLVEFDHWGSRRLAYDIKKKTRGYYVRVDYCGNGAVVDEMERFFKIDDRVMKYMTVLLEEEADLEKILADKAAAEVPADDQEEESGDESDDQATEETADKAADETPSTDAEQEE